MTLVGPAQVQTIVSCLMDADKAERWAACHLVLERTRV